MRVQVRGTGISAEVSGDARGLLRRMWVMMELDGSGLGRMSLSRRVGGATWRIETGERES